MNDQSEMLTRRLAGQVAIVTGGGHGIGKAFVQRLAAEGASVLIAELDGLAGQALAEQLGAQGYSVSAQRTDVTDKPSVDAMANAAIERFGRIDLLINNAAVMATIPMSRVPFDQIPPDEWDLMMRVNLKGAWHCACAVVPQMRKQGRGKIINMSSTTALKGSPNRIHYVTSKAGILGFTKTLALELGTDNICVNCIAPGSTLSEEHPDEALLKFRTAAAAATALKRIQTPQDLTGALVFLASADGDFVTGQTLVVDGGYFMH